MSSLADRAIASALLTKAETVKSKINKVQNGGDLNKEDIEVCSAMTPEALFGYSENERLHKLQQIDSFLENELKEYKDKLTKYMDAMKKMKNK